MHSRSEGGKGQFGVEKSLLHRECSVFCFLVSCLFSHQSILSFSPSFKRGQGRKCLLEATHVSCCGGFVLSLLPRSSKKQNTPPQKRTWRSIFVAAFPPFSFYKIKRTRRNVEEPAARTSSHRDLRQGTRASKWPKQTQVESSHPMKLPHYVPRTKSGLQKQRKEIFICASDLLHGHTIALEVSAHSHSRKNLRLWSSRTKDSFTEQGRKKTIEMGEVRKKKQKKSHGISPLCKFL